MEQSLDSTAYLTAEAFAADCAAIFHRQWFCAAREEDLPQPGDHSVIDVAGESVLLVRGKQGALHAHYNVCRHRGARLCDADSDSGQGSVMCPYHAWTYNLQGRLTRAMNMKGIQGFAAGKYSATAQDVSVKRLTRSNPTMAKKFDELR
jgi:Rieske 2Fe-2S family protein